MNIALLIIHGLAALVFAAIYRIAIENNWALFTYHPALEGFGPLGENTNDGRATHWYGWLANTALGAFATLAIASCPPKGLTDRIGPLRPWLIPSLVMVSFTHLPRRNFLR